MQPYFLKLITGTQARYVADPKSGLTTTLHPSKARALDIERPLPADVVALMDEAPAYGFTMRNVAPCLHPDCGCDWRDSAPKMKRPENIS